MKLIQANILCLLFFLSFSIQAAEKRPKIGLALSGGGAKGGAHIGVLKVLEELNVPIDYIAGTSAGSIVGGLYAAGYSTDEIEDILIKTDWEEKLLDKPNRPDKPFRRKQDDKGFLVKSQLGFNKNTVSLPLGVLQGQRLEQLFVKLANHVRDIDNFDKLNIPFRAVAADIETGKEVVIGDGNLAEAIRASMSIPGVLAPVERDGKLLVDGGVANNLPINVVRDMGADIVIAVDISAPLAQKKELDSVVAITGQLTTILTARNVAKQIASLKDEDIYIAPEVQEIGTLDFKNSIKSVSPGRDATAKFRQRLMALSSEKQANKIHRPQVEKQQGTYIHFIELDNNTNLHNNAVLSRMKTKPESTLDIEQIEKDIEQIYGLDIFQEVSYDIVKNSQGEAGLYIYARKKQWGPNYLQFGLAIEDNFSGDSNYSLGMAYVKTALNQKGGEMRIEADIGNQAGIDIDYYQPLDFEQKYFFNPELSFDRTNVNVFEDNSRTGEVQVELTQLGLGVGRNFGNNHSLRLDLLYGYGKVRSILGDIEQSLLGSFTSSELQLTYAYDSLDSLNFPKKGVVFDANATTSLDALGSDAHYRQYNLNYLHAKTFGYNTLLWQAFLGYSDRDDIPFYRQYSLGGFASLSGLNKDQISGSYAGQLSLAFYHQLQSVDILPVYLGATIEYGNVWQKRENASFSDALLAGSAFLGVDTLFGPLYFAYGKSEGGQDSFYLFVGNPFN